MGLEDLLDPILGRSLKANTQLRYMCPYCGNSDRKLYINNAEMSKGYGMWLCFNCEAKGALVKLVMEAAHLSFVQAADEINASGIVTDQAMYDSELTNNENLLLALNHRQQVYDETVNLAQVPIPIKPTPKLPYGLKYFRDHIGDPEAEPFLQYLEHRGFSRKLVINLGYGYITQGYAISGTGKQIPIFDHVVFFTYDDSGNWVYWNTRAIRDSIPKSVNAPNTLDNDYYGKGDLLYGLDARKDLGLTTQPLVLTEGVPDALTLYPYGVATFGKQITDVQKAILVQKVPQETPILVMLDMDAVHLLAKVAKELYLYHPKTYMVYNPTKKDANSLGPAKVKQVITDPRNLYQPTTLGEVRFMLRYNEA